MGIIVPEILLPSSNIVASNVYISFSGETIHIFKNHLTSDYDISSNYKVFSNPGKQPGTNIIEPIVVPYLNMEQGVYSTLYTALKVLYPNSEDYQDVTPPVINDPSIIPEPVSNVISY